MSWLIRQISLLVLLGAGLVPALAHDGLNAQIIAVTQQLIQQPHNSQLYLRRAELYRLQRQWKLALSDFQEAQKLGVAAPDLAFLRGRLLLDAKRARSAYTQLTLCLQLQPVHALAWRARAQAAVLLRRDRQAIADYSQAIDVETAPQPDLYLERAAAQIRIREWRVALADIEAGLLRLGNVIPLQLKALELEQRLRNWDAALLRIDALAKQAPRQETWLTRKGELLQAAGCPAAARVAFKAAWDALIALPPMQRNNRAMDQLAAQLQKALRH